MATKDQSHYRVRSAATHRGRVVLGIGELEGWCARLLTAAGFSGDHARLVAAALVDAEARGVSSHGIARVGIYVERLQGGLLNSTAQPWIIKETEASAHVDADNAVGHVGARFGLRTAIGKARSQGAGTAIVRHSNHCGALGYFVREGAEQGLITIAATNGPPVMAYYGGRTRAVGTNPIAFGVPRSGDFPLTLDMATSATARGKIILAGQDGTRIPEGWAVDVEGRPTTDPGEALEGAVVPFAGPKGSGLAMMIDLICGGLAAAITGERIGDMYEDWDREQWVSHFLLVLDPDAWLGGEAFRAHVAGFAERVHELPQAEGSEYVHLPGEVEERAYRTAREAGVVFGGRVFADLAAMGDRLGVTTPEVHDVASPPVQS